MGNVSCDVTTYERYHASEQLYHAVDPVRPKHLLITQFPPDRKVLQPKQVNVLVICIVALDSPNQSAF